MSVVGRETTSHIVRISAAELTRYGGADVLDLVRRSFEFLLEREPNTSVMRRFALSDIERFFPEYAAAMRERRPP